MRQENFPLDEEDLECDFNSHQKSVQRNNSLSKRQLRKICIQRDRDSLKQPKQSLIPEREENPSFYSNIFR